MTQPTVVAAERVALIDEQLARGVAVLLLPDGLDPVAGSHAAGRRLLALERAGDPDVLVIAGVVDDDSENES